MWYELKKLWNGSNSREAAKGRLHSVLAHDRTGLDGARMLALRQELALVLGRYVSIDMEHLDIAVERVGRETTELRVSSPVRARPTPQS